MPDIVPRPRTCDVRQDGLTVGLLVAAVTVVAVPLDLLGRIGSVLDGFDALVPRTLVTALGAVPFALVPILYQRHRRDQEVARTQDRLTGLPVRELLVSGAEKALAISRANNGQLGVYFVRAGGVRRANEEHGPDVGDELIRQLAERLSRSMPERATMFRHTGIVLVIVVPAVPNREAAQRIGENLATCFTTPFDIDGVSVAATPSIGVCLSSLHHDDVADVLRLGHDAMEEARRMGRAETIIIDRQSRLEEPTVTTETRIREALRDGEFEVWYQPVHDVESGALIGGEALLRWNDPTHGLVKAERFMPVLEATGLIVDVGRFVLDRACADAADWPVIDGNALFVSVNISSTQLTRPDFADSVSSALVRSDLEPTRLWLEVGEDALLWDVETVWSRLRGLKERGVSIALDDFGTGMSSLSNLRRVRLDYLKIDRSLIAELGVSEEATAMVRHLIKLSHAVGILSIAEGVETIEQLAHLDRLGCARIQGNLIAEPMPAADFRAEIRGRADAVAALP